MDDLAFAHAVGRALDALADLHPWMRRARCADADASMFFPEKGETPQPAKRLCATCPVTRECLAYGLDLDGGNPVGVFGGMTPKERQQFARQAA